MDIKKTAIAAASGVSALIGGIFLAILIGCTPLNNSNAGTKGTESSQQRNDGGTLAPKDSEKSQPGTVWELSDESEGKTLLQMLSGSLKTELDAFIQTRYQKDSEQYTHASEATKKLAVRFFVWMDHEQKTTQSVIQVTGLEHSPLVVINGYVKVPENTHFSVNAAKKTIKDLPYNINGNVLTLGNNQFIFKLVDAEGITKDILAPRNTFLALLDYAKQIKGAVWKAVGGDLSGLTTNIKFMMTGLGLKGLQTGAIRLQDPSRLEDVASKFGDVLKGSDIDLYIEITEQAKIETYLDVKNTIPSGEPLNGYAVSTVKIKFDEQNGTIDTYPYAVKNNQLIVQREDGSVILIYERLTDTERKVFEKKTGAVLSIATRIKNTMEQIERDMIKKEQEDDPLF